MNFDGLVSSGPQAAFKAITKRIQREKLLPGGNACKRNYISVNCKKIWVFLNAITCFVCLAICFAHAIRQSKPRGRSRNRSFCDLVVLVVFRFRFVLLCFVCFGIYCSCCLHEPVCRCCGCCCCCCCCYWCCCCLADVLLLLLSLIVSCVLLLLMLL